MPAILIQENIDPSEIRHWEEIFPHSRFIIQIGETAPLREDEWADVEILFGCSLCKDVLPFATQLRWIHCATPDLSGLCWEEIQKRGNILITFTDEENQQQIGEYVFGSILAFAKNLFHWHSSRVIPSLLLQASWCSTMWSLDSRTMLQIGFSNIGKELVQRASQYGLRVWGVSERRSFRPLCHKTFSYEDIHSALPSADIVCLHLPPSLPARILFGERELARMKQDAILVLLGSRGVDWQCLKNRVLVERLRGLIVDTPDLLPIPEADPFWTLPHILVTPGISVYPKKKAYQAVKNFTFNLRQYVQKNYGDMKNLVTPIEEQRLP